jgi:flagellar biosynthesis/type III secretory pathway chaperone
MNNPTEVDKVFVKIVEKEIEQSQRLLGLLKSEYTALQKESPQALQKLTEEKKQQLKQVETAALNHNRFLKQLGFTADRKGSEAFIQQSGNKELVTDTWHRFISVLEACQKQNQINGGTVQLNQRHVTQTLDILKGISQQDKTYGRSGESKPTSTSKSLGKA